MYLSLKVYAFLTLAIATVDGAETFAQLLTDVPENGRSIQVDQYLGQTIPKDLEFTNDRGEQLKLGKLFDGKKPVLMTLNYSDCPGLCVAQLGGLAEGVANLSGLRLGKDFEMVSISIDPRDTTEKLSATKAKYVAYLPPEQKPAGWHFLTSNAKTIEKVTNAVGFRYSYDEKADRFNHGSVAVLLSPDGVITRYLFAISFQPETLRLSLVEASDGKIGSINDQILLWCFHYDPDDNRYSADARRLLSFAAAAFVMVGAAVLIPFWFTKNLPLASKCSDDDETNSH